MTFSDTGGFKPPAQKEQQCGCTVVPEAAFAEHFSQDSIKLRKHRKPVLQTKIPLPEAISYGKKNLTFDWTKSLPIEQKILGG